MRLIQNTEPDIGNAKRTVIKVYFGSDNSFCYYSILDYYYSFFNGTTTTSTDLITTNVLLLLLIPLILYLLLLILRIKTVIMPLP